MTHRSWNPLLSVNNLTKELNACTDDIKNIDDRKSAQTERQQNRSSSLSFFIFLQTFHHFPPQIRLLLALTTSPSLILPGTFGFILNSKLSMKKHIIKSRQTAYFELKHFSLICRFLTKDAAKTLMAQWLLQPSPHGYTQFCHPTSPENSKLCCKTHSLGTPPPTLLLETPFQNVLSHLHVCQCWSCLPLWTATSLHSISYTALFFRYPHAENPAIQTETCGFHTFSCFGPHIWNSLQDRHCSTPNIFWSQTENLPPLTGFSPQLISLGLPSFCYSNCVCVCRDQ